MCIFKCIGKFESEKDWKVLENDDSWWKYERYKNINGTDCWLEFMFKSISIYECILAIQVCYSANKHELYEIS